MKNKIYFSGITIIDGLQKKRIEFSSNYNLIYSKKNSVGKSSLLRLLIYSLGYNVPSTKKLNFNKLELELDIISNIGKINIHRFDKYLKLLNTDIEEERIYSLPTDLNKILTYICSQHNEDIINNLLGSFYLDQEHGWTLLNRGKVLGKISFNIEALIRGLSNIDCIELINKLKELQNKLQKYKYMESMYDYKKKIEETGKNLIYNDYEVENKNEIDLLNIKKDKLQKELKEINDIIKNNSTFKSYINSYKLRVKNKDDIVIPVNEKTIIGYEDNNSFLIHKKNIISNQLSSISIEIDKLKKELFNEKLSLDTETLLMKFDRNISNIDINQIEVKKAIEFLSDEISKVREEISLKTQENQEIIRNLYGIIFNYSKELGLIDYINQQSNFIFTSDLKSLSGAILHKMVFTFKIAYIKIIKEKTGLILPIILDSPNGRETIKENVKEMIKILVRDYSEHQIIIASVFNDYDIEYLNKIEIKNYLME